MYFYLNSRKILFYAILIIIISISSEKIQAQVDGELTVTMEPPQAVDEGALWHLREVDDLTTPVWHKPGESVLYPPGTYTLVSYTIPGWHTPGDIAVEITEGESITQNRQYNYRPDPPPPINPEPEDGATSITIDTNLNWETGGGTTLYRVYFGTDSTPDADEFRGEQSGTIYDPGVLEENTRYYWRIDPKNPAGQSLGTLWEFQTENVKKVN